jgi:hypothetical protein
VINLAEKIIVAIQNFLGTNAERVAMTTTALKIGSTFLETDTGTNYKWNGTTWTIDTINVNTPSPIVSATHTRPDNATPYSANDVVGNNSNMQFNTGLINGSGFIITGYYFQINVATIPAGMDTFKLHLYDSAPTAINDNDAYNLPAADRAKYLGWIDIVKPIKLGDTLVAQASNVNFQGKLASSSAILHAMLTTDFGYTPTALAVKRIDLKVVGL